MFFPNVEGISRLMNDQYNELRKKFPQLSIERHMVMFESKRSDDKRVISIFKWFEETSR